MRNVLNFEKIESSENYNKNKVLLVHQNAAVSPYKSGSYAVQSSEGIRGANLREIRVLRSLNIASTNGAQSAVVENATGPGSRPENLPKRAQEIVDNRVEGRVSLTQVIDAFNRVNDR